MYHCEKLIIYYCAIFIQFSSAAKEFVIFRPGEFFDPFTETALLAESQQKPTITLNTINNNNNNKGSSYLYGENLRISPSYRARARSIGKFSGNSKDFNAQLWEPNAFLKDFDQLSNQAAQHAVKTFTPTYHHHHQPRIEKIFTPPPQIRKSSTVPVFRATPPSTIRSQNLQILPKPLKYTAPTPISEPNSVPSVQSSQSTNIIEQANRLLAKYSDLQPNPSSHHSDISASKSSDTGQDHETGYHKSHGDKREKGFEKKFHHNNEDHEKHNDEDHKSFHKENGGNFNHHHDEAGHYKKHHEGKKSHKAAKFGEKKGHKRGHKTTGYHNKFHRDEYHREHRFYDDAHKEGFHDKHGSGRSHHKSKEGAFRKGGSGKSGSSGKKFGKKGSSKKGHIDNEHVEFSKEKGGKKYHKHHKNYRKKHGGSKGKQYGHRSHHP